MLTNLGRDINRQKIFMYWECTVIASFNAQCLHEALHMSMGLLLCSQHHPEGVPPRDKDRHRETAGKNHQLMETDRTTPDLHSSYSCTSQQQTNTTTKLWVKSEQSHHRSDTQTYRHTDKQLFYEPGQSAELSQIRCLLCNTELLQDKLCHCPSKTQRTCKGCSTTDQVLVSS